MVPRPIGKHNMCQCVRFIVLLSAALCGLYVHNASSCALAVTIRRRYPVAAIAILGQGAVQLGLATPTVTLSTPLVPGTAAATASRAHRRPE
jgi:hypothetical protein